MINSTRVGMIVILAILLSVCLSMAFAENEKVNATNSVNMTNATKNMTLPQNMTNMTNNVINATINSTNMTDNAINVTINSTNVTISPANMSNTTKIVTMPKNFFINITINSTNATINPTNMSNTTKIVTTPRNTTNKAVILANTNNSTSLNLEAINATKNMTNEGKIIEYDVRQQAEDIKRDTENMINTADNVNEIKSALKDPSN